eukprot:3381857-Pyramimonas_sp.AAC.1
MGQLTFGLWVGAKPPFTLPLHQCGRSRNEQRSGSVVMLSSAQPSSTNPLVGGPYWWDYSAGGPVCRHGAVAGVPVPAGGPAVGAHSMAQRALPGPLVPQGHPGAGAEVGYIGLVKSRTTVYTSDTLKNDPMFSLAKNMSKPHIEDVVWGGFRIGQGCMGPQRTLNRNIERSRPSSGHDWDKIASQCSFSVRRSLLVIPFRVVIISLDTRAS